MALLAPTRTRSFLPNFAAFDPELAGGANPMQTAGAAALGSSSEPALPPVIDAPPMASPPLLNAPPAPPLPAGGASSGARHGFFGEGGVGRAIAGSMGDFLMQRAGMQPVYAPAMQRRSDTEAAMRLYEKKRRDAQEEWKMRQQWWVDHPGSAPSRYPGLAGSYYGGWGGYGDDDADEE